MEHQRVANYQILRKLSEGGMGVVYAARHLQLDRRAAIKVLHPAYAHHPEYVQRLLNEARAANLVEHPGIVEVFEVGQLPDQSLYIVMELLKGESLSARLDRCRRLTTLQTPCVQAPRLRRRQAGARAPQPGRDAHRDRHHHGLFGSAEHEARAGETRVFASAEHDVRPALGPPAPSPLAPPLVSPLGSSLESERQILLPKDRDVLLRESLRPLRGTRPGGVRPTAPGRPAPHRADDLRTIRRLDLRTRDPVLVD